MATDGADDLARARAVLAVLGRVDADLSASLDADEALRRVVAAVVPDLADWCAVDLVEGEPLGAGGTTPDRDTPDVVGEVDRRRVRTAVAHTDPAKQQLLWRMAELDARRPGASVVPHSMVRGRAVLLEQLTPQLVAERTGGDPELAEIFAALDNRAGAVVPLVARGRVIGALTVSTTGDSGRAFGPDDLAVLEVLAARAALAVDNARLFAAEAAERHRAGALAEAGIALSTTLRRRDVLDTLLSIVVPAVADYAFVLEPARDGEQLRPVAARDDGPERQAVLETVLNGTGFRRGRPGPGTAWATGRTQLHRDVRTALGTAMAGQPRAAAVARALGTTSSVHAPLAVRDGVIGVLSVGRRGGEAYTDAEARFLTELGRRAALALANADAYEAERSLATRLQAALLPRALPAVPGLHVAARYLPGDAGALVGGDWYDVLPLADGRVGLCVGDVMGRGAEAAALMGQLRAALRAFASEGLPPREVLRRLAGFVAALDSDGFATCLYAVHDPAAGVTVLASAGHPPPLIVRAGTDGTAPAPTVGVVPGPPLGVDPGSGYADTTVRLGAGDCLLLFTDGLVEDRDLAVDDGMARLAAGLATARPATAEAACAAALRVMGRDRAHDDDTAVLAVRAVAAGRDGAADDGPRSLQVRLTARPQAAGTARRHLTGALDRWGCSGWAETATLLVSELVANAVVHGHGPIELDVRADDDGLLVRIGDASPTLPETGHGQDDDGLGEHGRGLVLVEALADSWGWTARPDSGKDVWFRLAGRAADPG